MLNRHKSALFDRNVIGLLDCPSVCLSACFGAAPTGMRSVKFDIVDFYEDVLRNSKFCSNLADGYFSRRLSTFLLFAATLRRHNNIVVEWNGGRMLG